MPGWRRQRNCGLPPVKKIEFTNEISVLKTLARLGEGGPRQWWVRGFYEQKCEEIERLEQAPHPAYWPPSP